MSERSVHDNNVYAYAVLCERRRLVLHTEYRDGDAEEYTDVVFAGVVAHHFEDVLAGNILFGIDEVDPERIVAEWADLFARRKNYGWPRVEYDRQEELVAALRRDGVKGFEIGSSYGLGGWVLAAGMDVVPRAAKLEA
ncbi:MAG TPA: hypothetical protein VF796_13840 [Humisphaera sp.]